MLAALGTTPQAVQILLVPHVDKAGRPEEGILVVGSVTLERTRMVAQTSDVPLFQPVITILGMGITATLAAPLAQLRMAPLQVVRLVVLGFTRTDGQMRSAPFVQQDGSRHREPQLVSSVVSGLTWLCPVRTGRVWVTPPTLGDAGTASVLAILIGAPGHHLHLRCVVTVTGVGTSRHIALGPEIL